MLDSQTFKTIVEHTPLVSIDLCLVCRGEILLGKRNNEPLKDWWFTPGGRIQKNETWQNGLRRIALSELGLSVEDIDRYTLMGVWDHFYPNSVVDQGISTHYLNLPYYACFETRPQIVADDQHSEFEWFDLQVVTNNQAFHTYMGYYADWLINKRVNTDD
jgi:colanic acid biosynthesis protein WcaH